MFGKRRKGQPAAAPYMVRFEDGTVMRVPRFEFRHLRAMRERVVAEQLRILQAGGSATPEAVHRIATTDHSVDELLALVKTLSGVWHLAIAMLLEANPGMSEEAIAGVLDANRVARVLEANRAAAALQKWSADSGGGIEHVGRMRLPGTNAQAQAVMDSQAALDQPAAMQFGPGPWLVPEVRT